MFVVSSNRPDPVRARVSGGQQIVYSQGLQFTSANHASTDHGMPLLPDTRGPRRPHPGDVLDWVACLGGACLLLLCATT
jgi:hypothetical protein